jgi:hypothetical protein
VQQGPQIKELKCICNGTQKVSTTYYKDNKPLEASVEPCRFCGPGAKIPIPPVISVDRKY